MPVPSGEALNRLRQSALARMHAGSCEVLIALALIICAPLVEKLGSVERGRRVVVYFFGLTLSNISRHVY